MLLTNTLIQLFGLIIRVEIWCVCCIIGWQPRSWLGTTCI